MSIIRVKKDGRYFSASNEPFNDKRLSWEARGLMGYLLSKPNDWEIRQKDLEEQGPAGEHKLKKMLAELRLYGYMNRIRITLSSGKFDWTTEVFESPSQNPNPGKQITTRRFSTSGLSTSGFTTSGKSPDILNTESLDEEYGVIIKKWENLHTFLTPTHANLIGAMLDEWREHQAKLPNEHPDSQLNNLDVFTEAMTITAKSARNPHSIAYMDTIIKGWIQNGYGWKPKKNNGNGHGYKKVEHAGPAIPLVKAPEQETPTISIQELQAARKEYEESHAEK